MNSKHQCEYRETGIVRYTNPAQFQEECSLCRKIRWKMEKSLSDKTIVYNYEDNEIEDKDLRFLFNELSKRIKP